jgi:predicted RNase H-like HicB family nuclease
VAKITFHVNIHEEPDGSYWADVQELPGCFASGFNLDELKEALAEAMQLWLPDGIELGKPQWGPLKQSKSASQKKPASKMLVCA